MLIEPSFRPQGDDPFPGRDRVHPLVLAAIALAFAWTAAATQSAGWWDNPCIGLGPIILRSQSPMSLLRLKPTAFCR